MNSLPRLLLSLLLFSVSLLRADEAAGKISVWQGFERHDFTVAGKGAILVCPAKAAAGRPWIWRTEFFGHEPQADVALLKLGWHVAYVDVQNLYGAPKALDQMDAFYHRMVQGRALAPKVVLEGFSRGGLFSLNWAARNPGRVSSIYNDAPVCDFRTWPGGARGGKRSEADWQRLLQAYGITEEEAQTGKLCPASNLEPLAKAKIPLLHVCGDADEVVPFAENTGVVEKRYQELGGEINVIAKPGVKHHPHSLTDPAPIVEFVTAHFQPGKTDDAARLATPEDRDAALPDVLLIGDSISMGYTADVRKLLQGKANVWRIPVNGGPTTRGLEFLDDWTAERKWSVIHFNWGLHDLKYIPGAKGAGDTLTDQAVPGARQQVELSAYEENLRKLAAGLKATGARLVWAETTPVPAGAKGRTAGDEARYNAAAEKVMKELGIAVNPLHAAALKAASLQRPKDVHYTDAGSAALGEAVAAAVRKAME